MKCNLSTILTNMTTWYKQTNVTFIQLLSSTELCACQRISFQTKEATPGLQKYFGLDRFLYDDKFLKL